MKASLRIPNALDAAYRLLPRKSRSELLLDWLPQLDDVKLDIYAHTHAHEKTQTCAEIVG